MESTWRKSIEIVEFVEDQPHGAGKILSTQLLNPNSVRKRMLTRFKNVVLQAVKTLRKVR